jgi:hypothetical protein
MRQLRSVVFQPQDELIRSVGSSGRPGPILDSSFPAGKTEESTSSTWDFPLQMTVETSEIALTAADFHHDWKSLGTGCYGGELRQVVDLG